MNINDVVSLLKEQNNYAQCKRIQRACTEKIYLVDYVKQNDKSFNFKVTGSRFDVYNVMLSEDEPFTCDCPDAESNCHGTNGLCKHICFVLIKVSNILTIDVYHRKKLVHDELSSINFRLPLIHLDPRVYNSKMIIAYNNTIKTRTQQIPLTSEKEIDIEQTRNFGQDCPICFLSMSNNIIVCKECFNCIHESCALKWLKQSKTCAICRCKWEQNNKINTNINIKDEFMKL